MVFYTDVKLIKMAMLDKDVETITELSEKSGIDRTTLSALFNGNIQPSVNVMYKLIKTLELTPEQAGKIFFAQNLQNT